MNLDSKIKITKITKMTKIPKIVRVNNAMGFSLVEITIAIGLFAFVAVAILSLFSVALKSRADSSLETRSAMIAQEVFSNIKMSGGLERSIFRDGPALQARNNQLVDFTRAQSVVLGFVSDTTVPFGLWHSSRGQDPKFLWETGKLEPWAQANQIQTLAYVHATPVPASGGRLYQLTCEVRTPAALPLTKSRVNTYTTYFYQ